MADRWYYEHDKGKTGPCSDQELRNLADAGEIVPSDTIWKEGIEKGVSASKVRNLFPAGAQPSAVPADVPITKVHHEPKLPLPPAHPDSPATTLPPQAESASGELTADAPPDEPALVEQTTARPSANEVFFEKTEPAKHEKPPTPYTQQKPGKKRVVAGKGAILVGQDGTYVKIRKKCTVCGHEDSSWNTLPIRIGLNKISFFCTKCKKKRDVEFQGMSN